MVKKTCFNIFKNAILKTVKFDITISEENSF